MEGENNAPTLYLATNTLLARDLAVLFEYDFAVNDESNYPKGLLNVGIRWAFGPNMFFEFNIENILGKEEIEDELAGTRDISAVRKILKLTYYGHIQK